MIHDHEPECFSRFTMSERRIGKGRVVLLKTIGQLLKNPCYGIQRTQATPRDSIPSIASYYKNAVQMSQPTGPYYLIGFSFGTMVALEMAMQLQEEGFEVSCLILLDGGPDYFNTQIQKVLERAPKDITETMIFEYIEVGALLNFLAMYTHVENPKIISNILLSLPTQDARVNLIVDMTFGNVLVSPSPVKTRWLAAKEKLKATALLSPRLGKHKIGFHDAAQEVLRLKRKESAVDYIKCIHCVYNYMKTEKKFKGDINLMRIKADVAGATIVAADYGFSRWCTGSVTTQFYDGTHESFINETSGKIVAADIQSLLT